MEFKQTNKDATSECYEMELIWKGKNIKIIVAMQYHTFLKYWESAYHVGYGERTITPGISISNWEVKLNRKETRKACEAKIIWIKENPIEVIEELDDFYKKSIMEKE